MLWFEWRTSLATCGQTVRTTNHARLVGWCALCPWCWWPCQSLAQFIVYICHVMVLENKWLARTQFHLSCVCLVVPLMAGVSVCACTRIQTQCLPWPVHAGSACWEWNMFQCFPGESFDEVGSLCAPTSTSLWLGTCNKKRGTLSNFAKHNNCSTMQYPEIYTKHAVLGNFSDDPDFWRSQGRRVTWTRCAPRWLPHLECISLWSAKSACRCFPLHPDKCQSSLIGALHLDVKVTWQKNSWALWLQSLTPAELPSSSGGRSSYPAVSNRWWQCWSYHDSLANSAFILWGVTLICLWRFWDMCISICGITSESFSVRLRG